MPTLAEEVQAFWVKQMGAETIKRWSDEAKRANMERAVELNKFYRAKSRLRYALKTHMHLMSPAEIRNKLTTHLKVHYNESY